VKTPSLLTLAASLCLLLSSCVATSDNPLSPPETAHADPALLGNWLNTVDQETYRITAKQGPWMHVDVIAKTGAKMDSYDFYATTIGKNSFANVADPNGSKAKAYTFIRYSLSGKSTLTIWSMSSEVCAAAIKSGKLKGTIGEDKDPDVHLTNSSAELTQFIQNSNLDHLFANKGVLTKVSPR
jgi:hypothetical protein